jgi:hypothetical protein
MKRRKYRAFHDRLLLSITIRPEEGTRGRPFGFIALPCVAVVFAVGLERRLSTSV